MKAPAALQLTCIVLALTACGGSSAGGGTHSTTTTTAAAPPAPGAVGSSVTATASPGATTVSATLAGIRASMTAGTHSPRVGVPWRIHITLSSGRLPVRASGEYEFLFGDAVVAHRSHFVFSGSFSDVILWPSSAVGFPLGFRARIVSGTDTFNLDYPVQVSQ